MKSDNKSAPLLRSKQSATDSAFNVDFGAGQIRFVPHIVGIYFVLTAYYCGRAAASFAVR